MSQVEQTERTTDPATAGVGAFLLSVGLLMLGLMSLMPSPLGDLFVADGRARFTLPLALALAGLSLLFLEIGGGRGARVIGRILLALAAFTGLIDFLPGLLWNEPMTLSALAGVPSSIVFARPAEAVFAFCVLALVGSVEFRPCRVATVGLAVFGSTLLSVSLLHLGWSAEALLRNDPSKFGAMVLVGLSLFAILVAPVRWGNNSVPVWCRPLLAFPLVLLTAAGTVSGLRTTSVGVSDALVLSVGLLVALSLMVLVGGRLLRRTTKDAIEQEVKSASEKFEFEMQLKNLERDFSELSYALALEKDRAGTLELVATSVIDLVYLFDLRARKYVYMNKPVSGVLATVADHPSSDMIPHGVYAEDRAVLHVHFGQVESSRNDTVYTIECRVNDVDGKTYWLKIRNRAVRWSDDGRAEMVRGTVQDVTEQVLRDETVRANEGMLKSIMSCITGVVCRKIVYPNGTVAYTYMSDACEELFGITAQEAIRDAESVLARAVDEDRRSYLEALESSVKNLTPMSWVGRVRGAGDKVRWAHFQSQPRQLENGAVAFEGITLDITEQKVAEIALAKANARFDFLIEDSPTVVFSCSGTSPFNIEYVGQNVRTLFGLRPEDMVGKPLFGIGWEDPLDRDLIKVHEQRLVDLGSSVAQLRIVGASGKSYWIRCEVHLVSRSDETNEIIGSWTDVTDSRMTIENLVRSEHRLRQLESCVPGMLFRLRLTLGGKPVFEEVGVGSIDLVSLAPDDIAFDSNKFFELIAEQERRELLTRLSFPARLNGFLVWSGTLELRSPKVVEIRAAPQQDSDGSVVWDGVIAEVRLHGPIIASESPPLSEHAIASVAYETQTVAEAAKHEEPSGHTGAIKAQAPKSAVVVTTDVTQQAVLAQNTTRNGLRLKFATTTGQGLEVAFRERPDALVFLDETSDEALLRIVKAIRTEPSLEGTKIAVARSAMNPDRSPDPRFTEFEASGDVVQAIMAVVHQDA